MKFIKCNPSNYAAGRRSDIKYIVVHYTANNGDTAEGNCKYFANANVKASAHYFVDENEVCQSVEEKDTAYHCGAKTYRHADCRNSNSIGVELCCRKSEQGKYYFMQNTINNAAKLINEIAKKYNISNEKILRHYDVTGKICPEPFVSDLQSWEKFKGIIRCFEDDGMTQEKFNEMADNYIKMRAVREPSEWSKNAREWAENAGLIVGNGTAKNYAEFITKEQVAIILQRLYNILSDRQNKLN